MILWRNIFWNLTKRPYLLIKYLLGGQHKSKWSLWYFPHKKPWTMGQHVKRMKTFKKVIELSLEEKDGSQFQKGYNYNKQED